ncbi:MAG: cyanoexosortase B system-associated protein [Calothrix sp. MO_167.B12]|nr:cyanoexosortase B system-associated protein [Calothrix sp. MO_167.B12]
MTSFFNLFRKNYFSQIAVLVLLLCLLFIGSLPGYLAGKWQWQEPPPVNKLTELKQLRQTGLTIPGWRTVKQQEKEIDRHKWSLQLVKQEGKDTQAIIMLFPQNGPRDRPQVEWTEIDGFWDWDIAQYRLAELIFKPPSDRKGEKIKLKARFFRASTADKTFAVLQWYAWPNGGHPSPFQWFIVDQQAQWQRQRAAWVAVSVILPMEPRGQVEKYWDKVRSLGEQVQTALLEKF